MTAVALEVSETAMDAAFVELTLERRLLHERADGWATAIDALPPLGEVVASRRTAHVEIQVVRRDEGVVRLSLAHGRVRVAAACGTREDAESLLAVLRHQIPPRSTDGEEHRVTVSFWSHAVPEPSRVDRRLDVPDWAAIAGNYAAGTRERLETLMAATPPLSGGRLVLWHGPPGTGKTNALRALAYEWREHAILHYVTDPRELLTQPGYMHALLLDGAHRRWRLLVLEDAADLVTPDAGSGLARLLNLTDGFVGQGLRVLVLVTGNQPLDRLHAAVSRPGRCAAEVRFERFGAGAAAEWLAERGSDADVGPASLAELYGVLEGRAAPAERRPVGFLAA